MNNITGKRIKLLRKKENLSQTELANLLGVSCSCIANYEQGLRGNSNDLLVKISEQFGVSLDYLYGISEFPYLTQNNLLKYGGDSLDPQKEELISLILQKDLTQENINSLKNLIEAMK